MSLELTAVVDKWAYKNDCSRSEAIRRLVEAGLNAAPTSTRPFSKKAAAEAAGMAGRQIDEAGDPAVSEQERQRRKKRLTEGPEEFRKMRRQRKQAAP